MSILVMGGPPPGKCEAKHPTYEDVQCEKMKGHTDNHVGYLSSRGRLRVSNARQLVWPNQPNSLGPPKSAK